MQITVVSENKAKAIRHSFTRHRLALLQRLTGQFSADTLHYRKICAVPSAFFAHIFRPRNVPANA
jgi:hypothetical protein